MPGLKHTHSYIRIKSRPDYYKCADPKCSHYIKKEMILGKYSKCACGTDFILTSEDLRRVKPRCFNCSDTAEAQQKRMVASVTADVLAKLENSEGNEGDY
jgi:hypothetical protein